MNKKVLGLLLLGVFMSALDIAILGPAIHAIEKSFHLTSREIIWIINAYVFSNLISTPLLANLSDLYGRKRIYIISVILFGTGSLLVIAAPVYGLVVVGRAIQGFGSGGFFPIASAIIADKFTKEKQGSALGMIGAVYGLALIIGPVIGGLLLLINWRWVFVINIPITVLSAVGAWKLLESKKLEKEIVFDWRGMLLLIAGLILFAFSINRINTNQFLDSLVSSKVLPYLCVSLIILPYFVYHQNQTRHPIINTQLLKSRQLLMVYLLALGTGLAETGVIFIPAYVNEAFKLSYSNSSFALIPMLITLSIGALLAGRLLNVIGPKYILVFGTAMLMLGMIGVWKANEHIISFYIAEVVLGLGLSSILGAPLQYIINNETSEETRTAGQGIMSISINVGLIISASLIGALVASLGGGLSGYRGSFFALAFVSALMILAAVGLKRKRLETEKS